jgi:tetratricopeptide (TPR) repeat protein
VRKTRSLVALALLVGTVASCGGPARSREDFVRDAEAALASGDHMSAGVAFDKAARIGPEDAHLLARQAKAFEDAWNFRDATAPARRAADLLPDNLDLQLLAARVLLREDAFDEVVERMGRALVKSPRNVDLLVLLGNARAKLIDSRRGLILAAEAPDAQAFRVGLRDLRPPVTADRDASAESAFRTAIDFDPESEAVRSALANFLIASDRLPEATAVLTDIVTERSGGRLPNHALGAVLLWSGRAAEAEPYLQRVASRADYARRRFAVFQLSSIYMSDGRHGQVVAMLEPLLNNHDPDGTVSLRLAEAELRSGRRTEAANRLDGLIARRPPVVAAALLRARAALEDRAFDDATRAARVAVAELPDSSEPRELLGQVLLAAGDLENAFTELSKAVRLGPGRGAAVRALVEVGLSLGQAAAVFPLSRDAARLHRGDLGAELLPARTMISLGDYVGAEREARRLDPRAAPVQVVIGQAHAGLGRVAHARDAFAAALAAQSSAVDATKGLVELDLSQSRVAEALSRAQTSASRYPEAAGLLLVLAMAQQAAGNAEAAEAARRKALDLDPTNLEALTTLVTPSFVARHGNEAKRIVERLIARRPRAVAARLLLADINRREGNAVTALRHFEAVLSEPATLVSESHLLQAKSGASAIRPNLSR